MLRRNLTKERARLTISAERVSDRIMSHSGHEFSLLRGKRFAYEARGRTICLHTTNRMISRTAIERAPERVPLSATVDVQDLSAPSYIYGILMDHRIRNGDW